jgi:hypothetical protein
MVRDGEGGCDVRGGGTLTFEFPVASQNGRVRTGLGFTQQIVVAIVDIVDLGKAQPIVAIGIASQGKTRR